ncbi:hypothetical protein ACFE04_017594 [Oxalis oulophora]
MVSTFLLHPIHVPTLPHSSYTRSLTYGRSRKNNVKMILPVLKINALVDFRPAESRRKVKEYRLWSVHEGFTERGVEVMKVAKDKAKNEMIDTQHILMGLMGEDKGIAAVVLKSMGIKLRHPKPHNTNQEKIISRTMSFATGLTPQASQVLKLSQQEAKNLGHQYIGPEQLLLGLLRVDASVVQKMGADPKEIRDQIIHMVADSKKKAGDMSWTLFSAPTLEQYATNLTKLAVECKLDPLVGREKQIEQVVEILCRRTKSNPCIIGEPGVGKTAIAEGLAQLIADGHAPVALSKMKVMCLDIGLVLCGTKYRGEFEERIMKIVQEVKESDDIILFIDEIHTIVGAGSSEGKVDAANILKPALARGELHLIGSTTLHEYKKYIETDSALERRFQPVIIPEPSVNEAIQILEGLRERYEKHHEVSYTDEALEAAVKLSHQYISDRFLPDKAIDLIDQAAAKVKLRHHQVKNPQKDCELKKELEQIASQRDTFEVDVLARYERNSDLYKARAKELHDREMEARIKYNGPIVTQADIQEILSAWTGIPIENVSVVESERLLNLEQALHKRVIGQNRAVTAISKAIRRARVGLKDPDRPIASFFFSGPTGVGKTELAKALADCYFGSEEAMIRFDMSEFMERHTVSELIGSPPGYVGYKEGGRLTEAVRRRPHSVILFDEIEKAHSDIFNLMLQILEDGRLTDTQGRTVDFKNTLLIMTSNIGSSSVINIEHDENENESRIKGLVTVELKKHFKPEFLNRLDEIIVFLRLTKQELKEIVNIMLKEIFDRLKTKDIDLNVTELFKERVVEQGYDQSYGARPLRRTITNLLEDFIAEKILAGEITEGSSVIVDLDEQGRCYCTKSE